MFHISSSLAKKNVGFDNFLFFRLLSWRQMIILKKKANLTKIQKIRTKPPKLKSTKSLKRMGLNLLGDINMKTQTKN